jgi:starch-binding outer membrane protein, SusD/RagB family
MRMIRNSALAGLAVIALSGCNSLEVENPNAPDARRALADPAALEAVAGGTMRSWYNTWSGMEAVGVLSTQARSYAASWNNFNMNFYSSIDLDGTRNSRAWQNDLASPGRTSVEHYWAGYYATLSSAVDVLTAIRKNNVSLATAADTRRAETIAQFTRGASLSGIALNYDKGYIVDENTDLAGLQYSNRRLIRDAAVASLANAAQLAGANAFTTPAGWTNGRQYSSNQIQRLANTMGAMTLAYYARNPAENATTDWARVAQLASAGISSGTPFDFVFVGDGCTAWCDQVKTWFNSIDTGRLHTRIAALLDPATQRDPYPAGGNPRPNSADKRLGDGTFGDASLVDGFGTRPKTANGGSDFAWSDQELFNPARGSYHQSNIGHIRYDLSGVQDPQGIYGAFGPAPVMSATQNDLIWAEAEIRRSGGSLALAADLINKTRVARGGLAPATAAEGAASLLQKLNYEQELELLGLGASPFYFRRRQDNGLLTGTPREMPVPAKELGIRGDAFYTWGGSGAAASATP